MRLGVFFIIHIKCRSVYLKGFLSDIWDKKIPLTNKNHKKTWSSVWPKLNEELFFATFGCFRHCLDTHQYTQFPLFCLNVRVCLCGGPSREQSWWGGEGPNSKGQINIRNGLW